MDNSIYITLSKQRALFRKLDVIANNVANADTNGFKAEKMLFQEHLMNGANRHDQKLSFMHDSATVRDNAPGALRVTNRALDMAIHGNGNFTVETPLGLRYTRSGNFRINEQGELSTQQGYLVLAEGNTPIVFQPEDNDVQVSADGTVRSGGEERGILAVVTFASTELLEHTGDSLFRSDAEAQAAENVRVAQGMLEGSNVSAIREMADLIEISRAVGTTSNLIGDLEELQRTAVRSISKTRN